MKQVGKMHIPGKWTHGSAWRRIRRRWWTLPFWHLFSLNTNDIFPTLCAALPIRKNRRLSTTGSKRMFVCLFVPFLSTDVRLQRCIETFHVNPWSGWKVSPRIFNFKNAALPIGGRITKINLNPLANREWLHSALNLEKKSLLYFRLILFLKSTSKIA